MTRVWNQILSPLTPGVRGMVAVLLVANLAALAGRHTGAFDLYARRALSLPGFWQGPIWRLEI